MRIALAHWNRKLVGGAEAYLCDLIPALLDRGHEIALIHGLPAKPEVQTIDPKGRIPTWDLSELGIRATLDQISNWNPELVFVHGLNSSEFEGALLARFPAALFAHNYYGTCATGRKCFARLNYKTCQRRFGPACLALHYPRRCGGLNPLTLVKMYRQQARRNAFLPRYRALIVASTQMYEEYARCGVQDKLRLVLLPTTNTSPMMNPPTPRAATGQILFVGRLTDIKGADYLLKALAEIGNIFDQRLTLTVLGEGPERSRLERLASELGVRTRFLGRVDAERRNEIMRASDLLVVPSLWPEPFGLIGIEGGCVGLPAVGYEVGGIPDWLKPGESGELAPAAPPTVKGLADAIVRALSNSAHYQALRVGAWEVARRHSMRAHLSLLEPILESVIQEAALLNTYEIVHA